MTKNELKYRIGLIVDAVYSIVDDIKENGQMIKNGKLVPYKCPIDETYWLTRTEKTWAIWDGHCRALGCKRVAIGDNDLPILIQKYLSLYW